MKRKERNMYFMETREKLTESEKRKSEREKERKEKLG